MPTNFPTQQQMNAFVHALYTALIALPRIGLFIILLVACIYVLRTIVALALRLLAFRHLSRQETILLQLVPPAFVDKTPLATQKLFEQLHGWNDIRPMLDKLRLRHVVFSPEIAASRAEGIRFAVRIPAGMKESFEKDIASFSTDIRVQEIEDYIPQSMAAHTATVLGFKQSGRSFAYPLQFRNSLEQHDPVASLAAAMTNLKADELMVLQLVLSPVKVCKAGVIAQRLLHNDEHMDTLGKGRHRSFGRFLLNGISSSMFAITDTVSEVHHGASHYTNRSRQSAAQHREQAAMGLKPARAITALEQELAESIHDKLSQPLFEADIRVLVVSNDQVGRHNKVNDMRKALGTSRTDYQSIQAKVQMPFVPLATYRLFMLKRRLPSILRKSRCIFSAAEVAGIYHFPHSESGRVDGVVSSLSRTLAPSPLITNLADTDGFDVILGRNTHHGSSQEIGLTAQEREQHVYIIGGTGNGKSTMMKYAIIQDIKNGKGVAVVDPHGDLAKDILKHIPEERINDVVYFNPVDIKRPIGFNLLELPEGLDEDERLLEQNRIIDAIVVIFRKVFSDDDSGGHRIEDVLRNTIETAMTVKDATLFTVLKLLRNKNYRKHIVANLKDEYLKDFWREELGSAGDMQRVSMSKGVTVKVDRFRSSPPARRILEQPKSTINFEDIMNSGKILICNLAEGEIGEDTSALFGTTILAELKMAAERRSKMEESERRPFYLYVDEFQSFATASFVKMLSGSRKYKLFLTIAEQSTAQQEEQRMVESILSNVSTVICFRTGSPADEKLLLQRFAPFIERPGAISNLPTHHFYARLSAGTPQAPVSGETLLVDRGSQEIAERVIKASRINYGREHGIKKITPSDTQVKSIELGENRETYPDMDRPIEVKA